MTRMCHYVGMSSSHQLSELALSPLESSIWASWRILRRGPAIRRLTAVNYEGVGESPPLDVAQTDALEAILANQPLQMGDLAATLGIDSSTATRVTEKLERRGLVRRARRPDNGKYISVAVTSRGYEACQHIVANRNEAMHSILADFSEEQRAQLAELLEKMAVGLNAFVTSKS
jgi:DNA-binding MarR family transcriptional regulator